MTAHLQGSLLCTWHCNRDQNKGARFRGRLGSSGPGAGEKREDDRVQGSWKRQNLALSPSDMLLGDHGKGAKAVNPVCCETQITEGSQKENNPGTSGGTPSWLPRESHLLPSRSSFLRQLATSALTPSC